MEIKSQKLGLLTRKSLFHVDYVLLNKIIKTEMAVPSKLLEQVADRIISSAFKSDSRIEKCVVKVSKINPPINGDVEKVSVKLSRKK